MEQYVDKMKGAMTKDFEEFEKLDIDEPHKLKRLGILEREVRMVKDEKSLEETTASRKSREMLDNNKLTFEKDKFEKDSKFNNKKMEFENEKFNKEYDLDTKKLKQDKKLAAERNKIDSEKNSIEEEKLALEKLKLASDEKIELNRLDIEKLKLDIETQKLHFEEQKLDYENKLRQEEVEESRKTRKTSVIIEAVKYGAGITCSLIGLLAILKLEYVDNGITPSHCKDLLKKIAGFIK